MANKWTIQDVQLVNQRGSTKKAKKYSQKSAKNIPSSSANTLTKAALAMFNAKGFKAWRQNNGGIYDPVKKVFRRNPTSLPGISDIMGFQKTTGKILACEVKAGRDVLSDAQVDFLDSVKRSGGFSFVIRTSNDVEVISRMI